MSIRAMIRIYCIQKTNRLGIPPNKVNKPSAYTPDIMHVKGLRDGWLAAKSANKGDKERGKRKIKLKRNCHQQSYTRDQT